MDRPGHYSDLLAVDKQGSTIVTLQFKNVQSRWSGKTDFNYNYAALSFATPGYTSAKFRRPCVSSVDFFAVRIRNNENVNLLQKLHHCGILLLSKILLKNADDCEL
jgi:hypothetical protein